VSIAREDLDRAQRGERTPEDERDLLAFFGFPWAFEAGLS
jgi:hypothetical protein